LNEVFNERRGSQAMAFHKKENVQKYLGSSKTIDAETLKLADNKQFALPF
jgi:hypothetical protein